MTQRFVEALERAVEDVLDARDFDEYDHKPHPDNARREANAAALRVLAKALRGATVETTVRRETHPEFGEIVADWCHPTGRIIINLIDI